MLLYHYESASRRVQKLIEAGSITTWANNPKIGHWQASDLKTADYDDNPYNEVLPSADDIAGALNRLSQQGESHKLLSQASIGALAGVTTVLDEYWTPAGDGRGCRSRSRRWPVGRPDGDRLGRLGMCAGPARSASTPPAPEHALPLLPSAWTSTDGGTNQCAAVAVFHSCKGSNDCQAQGGCGFVQVRRRRQLQHQRAGQAGAAAIAARCCHPVFGGTWVAPPPGTPIRRRATTSASEPRRLRRADLGLAAVPDDRGDAAVRLRPTRGAPVAPRFRSPDALRARRERPRRGVSGAYRRVMQH